MRAITSSLNSSGDRAPTSPPTTSAATRAASRRTTRTPRSRRSRSGCSRITTPRAAGPGSRALSTARKSATRNSTASSTATRTRRRSHYFNYYEQNLTGNSLARHRPVVAGHLRHRSLAEGACSARSASTSRTISRSRPAAAGSSTTTLTACSRRRPTGFTGAKFLDDTVDNERGRFGLQAERDLQVRRRPHGLRHLFGGLPQRRQQSGAPAFDPAAHFQVGHARQLRDRRQDRVAGPPDAPQRRGLLMDWKDFAVQIEDPQDGRTASRPTCSSSATSTCRRRRSRASKPSSPSSSATPGRSTRRSATTMPTFRRRRC